MNTETMDEGTKVLLSNVKTLIVAAQRNGDPEVYSSMVLDFIPEDKYVQLYNFLIIPDSIDTAIHHVPEMANHREWFEALRTGILEQLAPEDGDGDNADHADAETEVAARQREDAGHGDAGGTPAGEGGGAQDASHNGEDRPGGKDSPSDP